MDDNPKYLNEPAVYTVGLSLSETFPRKAIDEFCMSDDPTSLRTGQTVHVGVRNVFISPISCGRVGCLAASLLMRD
jgi:hypothetical protein